MGKNKLRKFSDLTTYDNVYENYDPSAPRLVQHKDVEVHMKGVWAEKHFENDHPIILELACGRGEYTESLAAAYPEQNFIGVDVKGARLWKGASNCLNRNLKNAAFLRTRIEQIALFFEKDEVSEIWITFPDPFLRESKENKRLTSPRFLNEYQKFLKPGGWIHLKTDDPTLYAFTLKTLQEYPGAIIHYSNDDIYAGPLAFPELSFKTYYEKSHLSGGRKIKYIRFTIN
jgi:tRNA (guanine-N7-)-methyltransferase